MSQLVGELVKSGQHNNLMSTHILAWVSTTIAGTQMGLCLMVEFGALPLTEISNGKSALFHTVFQLIQHTTVRKAIHWVKAIREG